jgi:hypothetical protein
MKAQLLSGEELIGRTITGIAESYVGDCEPLVLSFADGTFALIRSQGFGDYTRAHPEVVNVPLPPPDGYTAKAYADAGLIDEARRAEIYVTHLDLLAAAREKQRSLQEATERAMLCTLIRKYGVPA